MPANIYMSLSNFTAIISLVLDLISRILNNPCGRSILAKLLPKILHFNLKTGDTCDDHDAHVLRLACFTLVLFTVLATAQPASIWLWHHISSFLRTLPSSVAVTDAITTLAESLEVPDQLPANQRPSHDLSHLLSILSILQHAHHDGCEMFTWPILQQYDDAFEQRSRTISEHMKIAEASSKHAAELKVALYHKLSEELEEDEAKIKQWQSERGW